MFIRLLKFGFIGTIVQLVFYYILLKSSQIIQTIFQANESREFIDNYDINLSIIILGYLLLFQNILTAIVNRKWMTVASSIFSTLIILIGWGEDISSWPIKTSILIFMSLLILASKFLIDKKLAKYLVENPF